MSRRPRKRRHRPRGTPARRPSPLVQSQMFRKLWTSTTLTAIAAQVASFAAVIAIWDATGSVLWMGILGLAKSVPIIVFALVGGMLADRIDRRIIGGFSSPQGLGRHRPTSRYMG
ncbi:MFS transporter [Rhodococcus sp. 5A-K4]|uniref:MFS transporter n=1 Tax=Rhodococcus sp. 5A-K4 TaxID=3384442 RepID=UPI0038D458AF